MNLLIGSDLVPTEINIDLFNKGDVESLLGKALADLWSKADIRTFNLETPLTDVEDPIDKQGPNLIAPTSTIQGIKELNPTLITLANNHILDQGKQGLKSTSSLLEKYDIDFIGAGDNLTEASKPYIIKKNGISIGIYTCAENEFTIATKKAPGANPFDPLESLDHISELKSKCDYVIVLYHGGKEHYRYPSPYLQKVCRKIIEKGADLVVCQHSHCIGSFEEYEKGTIIYGQGNFIFNKYDNEFWNTSLLIEVQIEGKVTIKYHPIVKNRKGIELATGITAEDILESFYMRSNEILQSEFIEEEYEKLAREHNLNYIRKVAGFGKWKSRFDRKLLNDMFVNLKFDKKKLLVMQNYIECEAHRELFLKGLKSKIKNS